MQTPLHIHATDISKEALRVAETNKFRLAFTSRDDSKLTLQLADRLEGVVGLWHLIVSNPPYIKDSDRNVKVHQQVDSHEPHLALYLPDSEYHQWFRDFFQQSHNSLLSGGLFLMEGHEDYLIELKEIALQVGFAEVSIIEDYTRRDRFLTARK
jgi:release factor glutamine methyltransferase